MYVYNVVYKIKNLSNFGQMRVSVVVPIYNIESCISYCVESIVGQNYENLEIILVDDGSTDKSPIECDCLADKYENIRVIHKLNGGLSSARNAGIEVATGDYILFVDGDDYLQNGAIKTLVEIAETTKADIVQYGYEEVFGYDGYKKAQRNIKCNEKLCVETDRHKFYENLYILGGVAASACTKFMRLGLVKSLRFKEGIIHEDEQFTSRLLAVCNTVVYINEFKPYKYIMREGSIIHADFNAKRVTDLSEIMEERLDLLKEMRYPDLVNISASKYFGNLMLFYLQAKDAKNFVICKLIDNKAKVLINEYRLRLSIIDRILSYIYKIGLSGGLFYYSVRKLLGK